MTYFERTCQEVNRRRRERGKPDLQPSEMPTMLELYDAQSTLANTGPAMRDWRENQKEPRNV